MKIAITHPSSKTIIDQDFDQVPLESVDQIPAATCTDIHLADCMDYVPYGQRPSVLIKVMEKLRYGGLITISGTDVIEVSRSVMGNMASVQQANAAIYNGRQSSDCLHSIRLLLEELGAKVITAKVDGNYYSVKAERPSND